MVQKVSIRSWVRDSALPWDDWKTLLLPFLDQGRIRQRKEKGGLLFSSAVPKIQWNSNPHCP